MYFNIEISILDYILLNVKCMCWCLLIIEFILLSLVL